MAKQGRYFRPKHKSLIGTPYDSLTEQRLHEGVFKGAQFHTERIPYSIEHKYEPDFIIEKDDGIKFIVEVKAIFNDSSEASKYTWIKKCLKDNEVLVMIFEKPHQGIHWKQKRKDGTKMSYAQWADKNGIMWLSEEEAYKLLED